MSQGLLFGPEQAPTAKPAGDAWVTMRVLITVKAAPNPSETYGETVCVAGIRLDLDTPGWVRLYPINFRELERGQRFKKYDVVRIRAKPARNDPRVESWKPDMTSLQLEGSLPSWRRRRQFVDPYIDSPMCAVLAAVRERPPARSLAAVRPAQVLGVHLEPHSGWTPGEQSKIDKYVQQIDMLGADRTALEAPRFKGWYRYRCTAGSCSGHKQGILDWEFVALQRTLANLDDEALKYQLENKFFTQMCAPQREVAFFVGNQAKRPQTFGVIGVYWPKR